VGGGGGGGGGFVSKINKALFDYYIGMKKNWPGSRVESKVGAERETQPKRGEKEEGGRSDLRTTEGNDKT